MNSIARIQFLIRALGMIVVPLLLIAAGPAQATDDTLPVWLYVSVLAGVISRTLVPWLVILQQDPSTPFDRKYLVPALIAIVLNLFAAPLLFSQITSGMTYAAAYLVGWASGDLLREGIKLVAPKVGLSTLV